MSGYGQFEYGVGSYGVGESSSSSSTAALIVYARKNAIGESAIVSGAGINIVDTGLDDTFNGSVLNPLLWTSAGSGSHNLAFGNGLTITLNNLGAPSSYTLLSQATFNSCDISVQYDILSAWSAEVNGSITYASLEYRVDSSNLISISRKFISATLGHMIVVSVLSLGVEVGKAALQAKDKSGKLRIIKHDNYIMVMYNDSMLYSSKSVQLSPGIVRIGSSTGVINGYIRTKFTNFKSMTGILFGTELVTDKAYEIGDRVGCTVPANDTVGLVNVKAFNHNGLVGSKTDAFEYPVPTGTSLSSMNGMSATVKSDSVLR